MHHTKPVVHKMSIFRSVHGPTRLYLDVLEIICVALHAQKSRLEATMNDNLHYPVKCVGSLPEPTAPRKKRGALFPYGV